MRKNLGDLPEYELEILWQLASLELPGSERELVNEIERIAKHVLELSSYALFLRDKDHLQLVSSIGYKSNEELMKIIEQKNPNHLYFQLGKNGELGAIFMADEHPITEKEQKIYELFSKKLENALQNIKYRKAMEKSEEIRKRLTQQSELILNSAGEGIIRVDKDGRVVFLNPAFTKMTGYQLEDLAGKTLYRIIHHTMADGKPYPKERCILYSSLKYGTTHHNQEEIFYRKDGTTFLAECTYTPIIEDKQIIGAVIVLEDITERKRKEDELKSLYDFLDSLITNAGEAIAIFDLDGRISRINPAFERLYGWKNEEIIGKRLPVVPEHLIPEAEGFIERIKKGELVVNVETLRKKKDGSLIKVLLSYSPIKDAKDKIIGIFSLTIDITEKKRLEEMFFSTSKKYQELFENIPVGIYQSRPDGKLTAVNQALVEILGYDSAEELLAADVANTLYDNPEDRKSHSERLKRNGEILNEEVVLRRKDGSTFIALKNARLIYDEFSKVVYHEGSILDITRRKMAEEELRTTKERLESLINNTSDVIIVGDLEGNILQANPALEKLYGWKLEEIKGIPPPFIPEELRAEISELRQKVVQGGVVSNFVTKRKKRDGTIIDVSITMSPITDESGKVVAISGITRDISEMKKLEQERNMLSDTIEATSDGVVIINNQNKIVYLNPAVRNLVSIGPVEDMEKLKLIDFLTPESYNLLKKAQLAIKRKGSWEGEVNLKSRNGKIIPSSILAFSRLNKEGKVEFSSIIIRDITEKKQKEEELIATKERLESFINNSFDAITLRDLEGNIIFFNPSYLNTYQLTPEDILEKKIDVIPEDLKPEFRELINKVLRGETVSAYQTRRKRKDGALIDVSLTLSPVRDSLGNIVAISGSGRDITRYKEAERELHKRDAILEAVSFCSHEFLKSVFWQDNISTVLEHLGRATQVSRVYIFQNFIGDDGLLYCRQLYEWVAEGITPQIDNPELQNFLWEKGLLDFWVDDLKEEKPVHGFIKNFLQDARDEFNKQDIKSILLMPIFIEDKWWGIIGFDECLYEREWSSLEIEALKTLSSILGSSIQKSDSFKQLKNLFEETVDAIATITEIRDPYTAGHQRKVSELSCAIAKELNLPNNMIESIRVASLLHDIGKIHIPSEILTKPRALTEMEFNIVKTHSEAGYEALKNIEFDFPLAEIILQHHELLNGTGYPRGLKKDKILLESKIITVADVVEAMVSHRPYRPALGIDKALEQIEKNKGILYDPEVVDVCIKLFKEKGFEFDKESISSSIA